MPPVSSPTAQAPDIPGAVWEPAAPGNFQPSARPSPGLPIDRIVIHDIEGTAGEAIRWFRNPQAQVSSPHVVDGQTGRITQMVREHDIAWHAGDHITNARSIGIEHEGFAYRPGFFNPREYEASAHLVRSIALRCGIPRDRTHHPGETTSAAVELSNSGDDSCPADPSAASDAVLRSQGPVYLGCWAGGAAWEPDSAFFGPGWVSPRFAASPAGGDTSPGMAGRFIVMLHAPSALLGPVTETFRPFKVPPAPRQPVPFGPVLTVSARVVPWDVQAALPPVPPTG